MSQQLHLLQPASCWLGSFWPHSHHDWDLRVYPPVWQPQSQTHSSQIPMLMQSHCPIWPVFSVSLPRCCLVIIPRTCSASSWMCLNSSMSFSVRFSWPGSLSSSSRQSLPSWLSGDWKTIRSYFESQDVCRLSGSYNRSLSYIKACNHRMLERVTFRWAASLNAIKIPPREVAEFMWITWLVVRMLAWIQSLLLQLKAEATTHESLHP